jgi:hypothetical protein
VAELRSEDNSVSAVTAMHLDRAQRWNVAVGQQRHLTYDANGNTKDSSGESNIGAMAVGGRRWSNSRVPERNEVTVSTR